MVAFHTLLCASTIFVISLKQHCDALENIKPVVSHHDDDETNVPLYIHEQHLAEKLLGGKRSAFRKFTRPVDNRNDKVTVFFGASLMQIVELQEKKEILVTRMWLTMEWMDNDLWWTPAHYGNLSSIKLHVENLWSPDIALYNTAESIFSIKLGDLATIRHNGTVTWEGSVLFRSSCFIDVANFPFDMQNCSLKLGPWTYTTDEVDLIMKEEIIGHPRLGVVEMGKYWASAQWDIEAAYGVKSSRVYRSTNDDIFADVTYFFILRRLPLFYTVNVMIPCFEISVITIMTFLLPVESFEKTNLSISVLVLLTVFLLRIIDIVPPTSMGIPLLGKYLLSTTVVLTLSIVSSITTVSIHYRTPRVHKLPKCSRIFFMDVLPRILRVKKPSTITEVWENHPTSKSYKSLKVLANIGDTTKKQQHQQQERKEIPCFGRTIAKALNRMRARGNDVNAFLTKMNLPTYYQNHVRKFKTPPPWFEKHHKWRENMTAEDLCYMCERMQRLERDERSREEWKFVGKLLDRALFIVYVIINVGTGMMLLLSGDNEQVRLPE